jgi:uncharacterized membrane protein YsdA (DUF1294 family)
MIGVAGWYLLLSLITFTVYGIDKRRAVRGTWRVGERTLHLLELLGGWPGAFAAQRVFHHKSRKTPFLVIFWAIVALHTALWIWVIYRWYR